MMYFNATIRNPLWDNRFKNIYHKFGATPFKHKFWEIQFMKIDALLCIVINWNTYNDHPGIAIEVGLLGYQLELSIYDERHQSEL